MGVNIEGVKKKNKKRKRRENWLGINWKKGSLNHKLEKNRRRVGIKSAKKHETMVWH